MEESKPEKLKKTWKQREEPKNVPHEECRRKLHVFTSSDQGAHQAVEEILRWIDDGRIIPLYFLEEFRRQIGLVKTATQRIDLYNLCAKACATLDTEIKKESARINDHSR